MGEEGGGAGRTGTPPAPPRGSGRGRRRHFLRGSRTSPPSGAPPGRGAADVALPRPAGQAARSRSPSSRRPREAPEGRRRAPTLATLRAVKSPIPSCTRDARSEKRSGTYMPSILLPAGPAAGPAAGTAGAAGGGNGASRSPPPALRSPLGSQIPRRPSSRRPGPLLPPARPPPLPGAGGAPRADWPRGAGSDPSAAHRGLTTPPAHSLPSPGSALTKCPGDFTAGAEEGGLSLSQPLPGTDRDRAMA